MSKKVMSFYYERWQFGFSTDTVTEWAREKERDREREREGEKR